MMDVMMLVRLNLGMSAIMEIQRMLILVMKFVGMDLITLNGHVMMETR